MYIYILFYVYTVYYIHIHIYQHMRDDEIHLQTNEPTLLNVWMSVMCAYVYTHTHTHTHTHIYIHTHVYYINICKHEGTTVVHLQANEPKLLCLWMSVIVCACVLQRDISVITHMLIYIYIIHIMNIYIYTYIHTYVYTYIHTYIHTYIQAYKYVNECSSV
jgi:hypothetical protein